MTEVGCRAEKVSAFGAKTVRQLSARHDHDFAFPSEGKVPEGRMRCRLRVAEPFTNEKVTLCSVTRCRATPHSSAPPPPSPQRGRLTVGFCFADRDFQTASPEVYAILCSCKGTQAESAYAESAQESTLGGLRRDRLTPPETPRRTGKPGAVTDRNVMHSGKSCRVRAKPALHYFFFPSTLLCFFLSKKEDVPLPIFSPPRRLHCPRPATA